jgi:hypothetical protein
MMNEEKEEPPGRQKSPGTWPSHWKCAVDSGKDGQEGFAALLAGHEVVTVPQGFATYHRRLTRIHWVPNRKALTLGESS